MQRMVDEQVDPSRVYATGLSTAARWPIAWGLEAPGLVAGIAAVAASLPVAGNLDCEPSGRRWQPW